LYFVYIKKKFCRRASIMWHFSLPLMNIFNKTEAISLCKHCLRNTFWVCFLRLIIYLCIGGYSSWIPSKFLNQVQSEKEARYIFIYCVQSIDTFYFICIMPTICCGSGFKPLLPANRASGHLLNNRLGGFVLELTNK